MGVSVLMHDTISTFAILSRKWMLDGRAERSEDRGQADKTAVTRQQKFRKKVSADASRTRESSLNTALYCIRGIAKRLFMEELVGLPRLRVLAPNKLRAGSAKFLS